MGLPCRPPFGGGATENPCHPRTGGEILVANLLAQGATHAFCVPGESYLPVLDALYDVARSPAAPRLPAGRRRRVHGARRTAS